MHDTGSFGYWVRRRRKMLDLTQDTLAHKVGCAVITLKKIEAGERRPSRQIAKLLAEALVIPLDETEIFINWSRGVLTSMDLASILRPAGQVETQILFDSPASVTLLVCREQDVGAVIDLLGRKSVSQVILVSAGMSENLPVIGDRSIDLS